MPSSNREGADAPSAAGELIDGPDKQDCSKNPGGWGRPMSDYEYIWFGNKGEDDYPKEACQPWYHLRAQIDDFQVNNNVTDGNKVTAVTQVTAAGITLTSRKPFDIAHPNKKGYRLRHVCLEGPESGVYYRGRLTGANVIELPEYWRGLVDPETITVTLTQIGSSQDLIIEKIEWGTKVKIKSGNGTGIDCFYLVHAERADGEKLIVEYQGESSDDYPGDNSIYSINK